MSTTKSSDTTSQAVCPICMEELDPSDRNFFPCPCNYQVSFLTVKSFNPQKNNRLALSPSTTICIIYALSFNYTLSQLISVSLLRRLSPLSTPSSFFLCLFSNMSIFSIHKFQTNNFTKKTMYTLF
jgi:hypothetical protein